ncbi:MAG: GntR family transcriptional regulator [Verrucomicrobiales bacterium]|nr:GntR family transcriptional regulator [Verrucomicrobiales bacterium]
METTPVSSTLAEAAAARLRSEIVSGELPSGARLAEAVVAQRLGVSRVPVREALVLLEREGLVEFTATGRACVKALSPRDFEEIFVLRLALEPVAARLAAPTLKSDMARLEDNLAATREARSLREVTTLDLEFHEIIIAASANSRLLRLWCSLRSELELWLGGLQRSKQIQTSATQPETVASHEEIVRGFRTGTPADCERLMRRHILGWREWLPTPEEMEP